VFRLPREAKLEFARAEYVRELETLSVLCSPSSVLRLAPWRREQSSRTSD